MRLTIIGKTGIKYRVTYKQWGHWSAVPVASVPHKTWFGVTVYEELSKDLIYPENKAECDFNSMIKNEKFFEDWYKKYIKHLESNLRKPEFLKAD